MLSSWTSRIFCCLILPGFVFCQTASAQAGKKGVQITLNASARTICLSDTLAIEYSISGDISAMKMKLPAFPGWELVEGPQRTQEESSSQVNGVWQYKRRCDMAIRLIPRQTGKLHIPGIELIDKRGVQIPSPTKEVQVVTDCKERRLNASFHSMKEDVQHWANTLDLARTSELSHFPESLLSNLGLYVLSIESEAGAGIMPQKKALYALNDRLKNPVYKYIGVFSVSDRPALYYSLSDTSALREKLQGIPAIHYSIISSNEWALRKEFLKLSPEYKRMDEIASSARGLIYVGEDLDTPRNIYTSFNCKTEEERTRCIAWAKAHGMRAPQPTDLNPADKSGNFQFWISIHEPALPEKLAPKIDSIISEITTAFPSVTYADVVMQQLKQTGK